MCIKCGCGKKKGQAGYGMGPKGGMKNSAGLFGTKKKAVAKRMGKKK